MLALRRDGERITFTIRVTPRASANAVAGERDGALLVRVSAPPVEGKANDAVVAVLAKALGLPNGAVRVERGGAARMKLVSVPRRAEAALRQLAK
ncbi:MAG: DUF167 domain-containing protein [Chloroflexi bacterium]|nr:MAG: DUF167 domain-containing protein [Chloroflexota bacterium]TMF53711.1 MAG: DUF167 domain-containing protein [Chloroflexota bacterium]